MRAFIGTIPCSIPTQGTKHVKQHDKEHGPATKHMRRFVSKQRCINGKNWAVVVAQLVMRLHPTPEILI